MDKIKQLLNLKLIIAIVLLFIVNVLTIGTMLAFATTEGEPVNTPEREVIIWNSTFESTYGEEILISASYYDSTGTEKTVSLTWLDNETNSFEDLTIKKPQNVGSYILKATVTLDTGDSDFYHLYTIKPKSLTIEWSGTFTSQYGSISNDITATALDINENSLSIEGLPEQTSNVGSYIITATTTDSNYTLSNATHVYTITPYTSSVIWNGSFKRGGDPLTATYTNVKGENVSASIEGMPGVSAEAGSYFIKATTTNSNYLLTNAEKVYTIPSTTEDDLQKQISDLNDKIAQLNTSIEQLKSEKASNESKIAQLNADIEQFKSDKTKLSADIEQLNSDKVQLNATIEQLKSEKASNESKIAQLNASIEQLKNNKTTNEAEIAQLNARIKQLNSDKTKLNADIEQLNSNIEQLNSDKTKLDAGIANLQDRIKDLDSKIIALTSDKEQLTTDKNDLTQQVGSKNEEINNLHININDLEFAKSKVEKSDKAKLVSIIVICSLLVLVVGLAAIYFWNNYKKIKSVSFVPSKSTNYQDLELEECYTRVGNKINNLIHVVDGQINIALLSRNEVLGNASKEIKDILSQLVDSLPDYNPKVGSQYNGKHMEVEGEGRGSKVGSVIKCGKQCGNTVVTPSIITLSQD